MKKGIHPIKKNTRLIASTNSSFFFKSVFNIKKYKTDIDPFSHFVFNEQITLNTIRFDHNKTNKFKDFFNK